MSPGQEARHLRNLIGERVAVTPDDGPAVYGVLKRLTPQGPMVLVDGEDRERRAAAWRISRVGAGACVFCGATVAEDIGYRRVQGFERIHRPAGGTNALRLREPTSVLACKWCVEARADGRHPGQGTLA